ncbi:roadblock/LC7 domain-containing protein [Ideonella livida]|uniref:roadblock/LC7 domain-containing protein n=1 Tax=Ideonella livida TaxID=2707176 RepID=UPI002872E687|nr:roadblock/LC7 domain-containing protein [Ideonella livida]
MNLDPDLQAACARAAQALLDRLEDARAVVVATEDGFDVACAARQGVEAARLAAMTSSITAIGEVASREADMGAVTSFVVDAQAGYLVLRPCRRGGVRLVLAALTHRQVLLGLVLHAVAEAARGLEA